jgi:hypothetical protein
MRKLSDVTMEQRPLTMCETAAVMESCNPMRDCHAGSILVTGDYMRGTRYQVPITFTRFENSNKHAAKTCIEFACAGPGGRADRGLR